MKKSAVITIFKKELSRFFKDRRTVIAIFIPGILIYVMYSLMGGVFSDAFGGEETYIPQVVTINMPDSIKSITSTPGNSIDLSFTDADESQLDEYKTKVSNEELDLLIIFPKDFDTLVKDYIPNGSSPAPNIQIYYNSTSTNSTNAYTVMTSILDIYESSMTNKFDINRETDVKYDLADEKDIMGMVFSMLMPMLLIMLLFSGCMSVAPESIAGEKERGTIASLLITPARRSDIAIGKILALSVLALLSGTGSALGVILSLPKLMGGAVEMDASIYGAYEYTMLALVILSTVLVLITIISIISAFAKSVKEASGYVTPLMIISMLVGLSGMFGSSAKSPALFVIPIYNSVQCISGIFSFNVNTTQIVITLISNIIYTAIGVFVLAKMFNSEKVMFRK